MGTEPHANLPMAARPIVTAGFKWAPLKLPTAYTATATPNAQPAVMTIHPAFWPLVWLSTTLATTPSPRMINSMVPSSSARKGGIKVDWEAAKLPAGERLVYDCGMSVACPRHGPCSVASLRHGHHSCSLEPLGYATRILHAPFDRCRVHGDLPLSLLHVQRRAVGPRTATVG